MTARPATPPGPIAPWAEIVPDAPYPMTIQDLLDWPDDDGYRYELVDGVLVRVAGSGDKATRLGLDIAAELRAKARPRRLGRATGADGVYKFPGAETGLIPDAGYDTAARRALIVDESKPLPFAPDLAVELASPSQDGDDMAEGAGLSVRRDALSVDRVAHAETHRRVATRHPRLPRRDARRGRPARQRGRGTGLRLSRRRRVC